MGPGLTITITLEGETMNTFSFLGGLIFLLPDNFYERNSCYARKVCAMFGSKEKDQNVKCLQTDREVAYR